MSTKHTREELLYLAKLAEQCERYDGKLVSRSSKNCDSYSELQEIDLGTSV